jgi:hypothetical protein
MVREPEKAIPDPVPGVKKIAQTVPVPLDERDLYQGYRYKLQKKRSKTLQQLILILISTYDTQPAVISNQWRLKLHQNSNKEQL